MKTRMFQGGKDCKNRYKAYYYRHSTTYGRAHREAVIFKSEKLDRNTHPERKGAGILSNGGQHRNEVI